MKPIENRIKVDIDNDRIVIKNPYGAVTLFKWFCKLKGEVIYVDKNGDVW